MDIQCIIDKFKSYGYQLYLQDGLLRYKYTGTGKPSEEALRMVEELRTCKNEVIAYLKQQETFESIFKDTVHELNREYPQGLVDHIRQKHSGLWDQGVQAENRINWLWDKDLEAFKKAVSDWREIELAMIRLFKEN